MIKHTICPICDKTLIVAGDNSYALCQTNDTDGRSHYAQVFSNNQLLYYTMVISPFYIEWIEETEQLTAYYSRADYMRKNHCFKKMNASYQDFSDTCHRFKNLRPFL